jgi:hypothetical protein
MARPIGCIITCRSSDGGTARQGRAVTQSGNRRVGGALRKEFPPRARSPDGATALGSTAAAGSFIIEWAKSRLSVVRVQTAWGCDFAYATTLCYHDGAVENFGVPMELCGTLSNSPLSTRLGLGWAQRPHWLVTARGRCKATREAAASEDVGRASTLPDNTPRIRPKADAEIPRRRRRALGCLR